ncbi:MAG: Gldg family protein [Planctomycetota bacterium]
MSVVQAVFKRNLASFFGNPIGYIFIILFVGGSAWVAFVMEGFFANNQANLNQLTIFMPILYLLFVPAVTMSTWAEEKKLGTDELLFTLPCGDLPVVIGKFLAALAIFTAAILFTLSHVVILFHLGDPDIGLLLATYFGYWLMGAAFIATGMFASSLTNNITVGFILGLLFCAVFAFTQKLALIFPGRLGAGVNAFAAVTHLESFGRGVVAWKDIAYFLSITVGMLYLNAVVLSRRRWPGGTVSLQGNPKFHVFLRIIAVAVILVSVNVLFARFGGRVDVTEEQLSSLSQETYQILDELTPDKPVYIQAWITEKMPPAHVRTRDTLLGLLKEFDARGGDAVRVKIHHPERFSEEAQDAKDKFGIFPMPVYTSDEGEPSQDEIFMGAAIICGVEEQVIPFFHSGIPVEYELNRTIRVVTKGERPKVGVVENDLKMLGGFDFQTRQRNIPWQVVQELKKQYEVESIRPGTPIPEDLDVVICAIPSLLKDEEIDHLVNAIRSGKPTLLFMDPLPLEHIPLSPKLPRPSPQQNPFMQQRGPTEPKGDLSRLLNLLGVRCSQDFIIWDTANPIPLLRYLSPEFVFITNYNDEPEQGSGFNEDDEVTSGLQQMLTMFPGSLSKTAVTEGDLVFEPLLRTGVGTSGSINWNNCVTQSFFGPTLQPLEGLKRLPRYTTPQNYILAARIRGELPVKAEKDTSDEPASEEETLESEDEKTEEKQETTNINVILVADLDLISNQFFLIRREKRWLEFDNVPFVLNCVDTLAGEDSYISLRKRRKQARTLTKIEGLVNEFTQTKLAEEAQAEAEANLKLLEVQASFDEKVQAVENRTDLDMRTKEIMLASVRKDEQRKLSAKKAKIEEDKNKKVEAARFTMEREIREMRVQKKITAVILPILPPLIIALFLFFHRRARENLGAEKSRLLRD